MEETIAVQGGDTEMQAMPEGVIAHTALADWYALLAFLFQPPTAETIANMQQVSLADDFRAIVSELGAQSSETDSIAERLDALKENLAVDDNALSSVRREYTRLFSHPKLPLVWPYEGVFHDSELEAQGKPTNQSRLFVNPSAADAERQYRAAGFDTATLRVPADSITTELEFAGLLHEKIAAALLEGDDATVEDLEAKLRKFADTHFGAWARRFFTRVSEECAHEYFELAGRMGLELMTQEKVAD